MARPTRTIDATAAELQQVLERDYAHLEWRVLVSPAPHVTDVRSGEEVSRDPA